MIRPTPGDAERWRELLARDSSTEAGGGCPPADELWASAQGELARDEENALLDHVVRCGTCTAAWSAARELGEFASRDTRQRTAASLGPVVRWSALAAALLLAALLPFALRRESPPAIRAAESVEIVTACDATLPRERFELVWSGVPEGSTFDVRVTTADLDPVAQAFGLKTPVFVVPGEKLAALPDDAVLLWRVHARLPDGRRVSSVTFSTRLR